MLVVNNSGQTIKSGEVFYYLVGIDMAEKNLQERLAQCRKDKAAIEKEEQELLEQIEKEKEIPIISFANFENIKDRVVINLTPDMMRVIKTYPNTAQITIDAYGGVGDHRNDHKLTCFYSHQQPIFGTFNPNSD